MTVVDASAIGEMLVGSVAGHAVADRIAEDPSLHAPQILMLELGRTFRKLVRRRVLGAARAERALERLLALRVALHPHEPLVRRAWALRDRVSFYDAAYLALAEALDAPLLTCDRKLARVRGHRANVVAVRAR